MAGTVEQISLAAKNYAEALVQIGQGGLVAYDVILSNLRDISDTLNASDDLRKLLINPTIDDESKVDVIRRIFSECIDSHILTFLEILVAKKRIGEFNEIYSDYVDKLDEINNIQPVEVVSAVDLRDEYKSKIVQKLSNKLGKNIKANWNVDSEILAGLKIKIDDNVIDMSLKNRIDKLSKDLMLK